MRREQIFKICLNHALTHDIEYTMKDSKAWHFVVNDYSEGGFELSQFCLRFKTEEIAQGFKQAIDDALNGVTSKQNGASEHTPETQPRPSAADRQSAEEAQNIRDLKLPENFYDYKNAEKCSGCRGCRSEEFKFPEVKPTNEEFTDDNPLPLVQPPTTKPNDLSKETQPAAATPLSFNLFSNSPAFGSPASKEPAKKTESPASASFFFGNAATNTPKVDPKSFFGGTVTIKSESPAPAIKPATFSFSSPLLGDSPAAEAPKSDAVTNANTSTTASPFSFTTGQQIFGAPAASTQSEPAKTTFSFNTPSTGTSESISLLLSFPNIEDNLPHFTAATTASSLFGGFSFANVAAASVSATSTTGN